MFKNNEFLKRKPLTAAGAIIASIGAATATDKGIRVNGPDLNTKNKNLYVTPGPSGTGTNKNLKTSPYPIRTKSFRENLHFDSIPEEDEEKNKTGNFSMMMKTNRSKKFLEVDRVEEEIEINMPLDMKRDKSTESNCNEASTSGSYMNNNNNFKQTACFSPVNEEEGLKNFTFKAEKKDNLLTHRNYQTPSHNRRQLFFYPENNNICKPAPLSANDSHKRNLSSQSSQPSQNPQPRLTNTQLPRKKSEKMIKIQPALPTNKFLTPRHESTPRVHFSNKKSKSNTDNENILPALTNRRNPQKIDFEINDIFDKAQNYHEDPVIKNKIENLLQNIVDIRNVLQEKSKNRFKISSAPVQFKDKPSKLNFKPSKERVVQTNKFGISTNTHKLFTGVKAKAAVKK